MLSPFIHTAGHESRFESELSLQSYYQQLSDHQYQASFIGSTGEDQMKPGISEVSDSIITYLNHVKVQSMSDLHLTEGFTLPPEGESRDEQQPNSESTDPSEFLSVPQVDVAFHPRGSLSEFRDSTRYYPICSCEEKNIPPGAQKKQTFDEQSKENVSRSGHLGIPQITSKRRFRIGRISSDQYWIKTNETTRSCQSVPVLSTVPPIYRILMRKPNRRLLLPSRGKFKRVKVIADKSCRTHVNTGRVRLSLDARLRWGLTSRVNKTPKIDLEELSTQDISLHTTTPSSVVADQKKTESAVAPAPFVLVRYKSKRQTPFNGKFRRHPSSWPSHPVLLEHRSRTDVHPSDCLLSTPPPRAHSFCAPLSVGLDRAMTYGQERHSESSSVDISDPEYGLWQTRIKSYLDAAAQADAMVRSQYCTASLKQCLFPHHFLDDRRHRGSGLEIASSTDESSSRIHGTLHSSVTTGAEQKTLGLECQEPLLHFWDDYQHIWRRRPYSDPLYSNSSDTDGCEPVSTFVEEFPWDDIAISGSSDASRDDLVFSELRGAGCKSRVFIPRRSVTITPGDIVNNGGPLKSTEDPMAAPVYRQDTMELSTSTSVLFNQKSSSLEASFEICSQSVTTGGSNGNNNHNDNNNSSFDTRNRQLSHSNGSEPLCGLRTHPDGGSQHCLDLDSTSEVVQSSVTDCCLPSLESHFLTRVPVISPAKQQSISGIESEHNYFNPYLMDQRKCQTLPRVSSKRKRRQQLAFDRCSTDPRNEPRLSTTGSLDELHERHDRIPRLDILRFSRQRLLELRTLFHRLMQINPIQTKDTDGSTCDGISLSHWQNSLSHVIHLAEENLQILADRSLGSVVCSTSCTCAHKSSPISVAFGLQSRLFTCPELKRLHLQWIRFTDIARYWLLQSCSQETIRQQLIALRARIAKLDQFMKLFLAPRIGFQSSESEQPHKPSSSSIIVHGKQEHNVQLAEQIKHCTHEIEEIGEHVFRLREEFENHVTHAHHISCDPELVLTTNVVAWHGDKLVNELDQLSHELSSNRQRLTSWLAMKSVNHEERDSSNEEDWEHVNRPTETEKSETLIRPRELLPIMNKEKHKPEATISVLPIGPSHSAAIEHKYRPRVALITGGLVMFTCFCCYIITKLIFCQYRPCDWSGAFLNNFGRIFELVNTRERCPLQRERLSSLMDYTPGSVPF